MLKAFNHQLQAMSKDPQDSFTATIRKRVGVREALRFEGPLRKMILAMPAMIAQIRAWSDEAGQPLAIKKLHSFSLAYLYNPTDFLPEKTNGLFGYLDDAYLVASVFQKTIEEIPHAGLQLLEEDSLLKRKVPDWLDLTRNLIPEESSRIDQMLDRVYGMQVSRTIVRKARSVSSLTVPFR
jgi:uncharacterized membrane protein YkvA (DUF1232 family)